MPELPEVETIARQLQAALAEKVLVGVAHVRPDMVRQAPGPVERTLARVRVQRVYRRAKRIVFELEPAAGMSHDRNAAGCLVIHLGMTGRLTVCPADLEVEKHTHLRVGIEGGGGNLEELRFVDPRRFGGIWVLSSAECGLAIENDVVAPRRANAHPGISANAARNGRVSGLKKSRALGPLGPEPLGLDARRFRDVLARHRQIKALLLDQTAIAGLGNIYCDEALHAAGIHPLTSADTISPEQAGRLLRAIKNVLRRAIRFNGSTLVDYRSADGEPGSFQRYHRVYNREGKPCRNCRTSIERMIVAGRSSCFCPKCQRGRKTRRRP